MCLAAVGENDVSQDDLSTEPRVDDLCDVPESKAWLL